MTLDQKRKAPIFEIANKNINLGSAKQGKTLSDKITLNNRGQNALEIRRIINNSKEISVSAETTSIKGGKSTVLYIKIDTETQAPGDYKRNITLQTNDPDNNYIMLILSWKVQK